MPTIDAIHICCPGPSLADFDHRRLDGGFVIAVNAAAEVVRADAWCCLDKEGFVKFRPIGRPIFVAIATMKGSLLRSAPERRDEWNAARWACLSNLTWPSPRRTAPDHYAYTGLAALVYAVTLAGLHGLDEVEIHGCDLKGTADCTGHVDGRNRGDDRWENEARGLRHGIKVAAERGVAVRFDAEPAWLRAAQEVAA